MNTVSEQKPLKPHAIKGKRLSSSFYTRPDVVQISKELLGKYLFTSFNGKLTGGIIVETEAYHGPEDKASHAFGNRRTSRTEVMYACGGVAYVYLCYGIHSLFNIVTNTENIPHAVLIRAIEPTQGLELMLNRRNKSKADRTLTGGPGALAEALGMKTTHTGLSLLEDQIWLEDRKVYIRPEDIIASPRVGVQYAKEDALLPWRFRIRNNPWTSPAK